MAAVVEADCDTAEAHSTRYETGLPVLRELAGTQQVAVLDNLAGVAPDLGRYLVEFGYGDLYSRPQLPVRERLLAAIAALTALGNAPSQLKFHVNAALNAGISRAQIVETIMHVAFYAGFPASINAALIAKEVFAARAGDAGAQSA